MWLIVPESTSGKLATMQGRVRKSKLLGKILEVDEHLCNGIINLYEIKGVSKTTRKLKKAAWCLPWG